jgi:hypothetical protein
MASFHSMRHSPLHAAEIFRRLGSTSQRAADIAIGVTAAANRCAASDEKTRVTSAESRIWFIEAVSVIHLSNALIRRTASSSTFVAARRC